MPLTLNLQSSLSSHPFCSTRSKNMINSLSCTRLPSKALPSPLKPHHISKSCCYWPPFGEDGKTWSPVEMNTRTLQKDVVHDSVSYVSFSLQRSETIVEPDFCLSHLLGYQTHMIKSPETTTNVNVGWRFSRWAVRVCRYRKIGHLFHNMHVLHE